MLQYGDLEGPKKGLNIFYPNFVNRAIKLLIDYEECKLINKNFSQSTTAP